MLSMLPKIYYKFIRTYKNQLRGSNKIVITVIRCYVLVFWLANVKIKQKLKLILFLVVY